MEEKGESLRHNICIENRAGLSLTGVGEVIQFNDKVLVVNTNMGRLQVDGNNLHVTGYDEKKGELNLSGEVDGLRYSNVKNVGKTTKGIVGRMFR